MMGLSTAEYDALLKRPLVRKSPRSASRAQALPDEPRPEGKSPRRTKAGRRDYKAILVQQLHFRGIDVEPEFVFAPPRKFRADWKVVGYPVLVEYDGGIFTKKADGKADVSHSSPGQILWDMEKSNTANIEGYTFIRVTSVHVVSGQALLWIEAAIERNPIIHQYICRCGLRVTPHQCKTDPEF